MALTPSAQAFLEAFDKLGPNTQESLLHHLDDRGDLGRIKASAVEKVLLKSRELRDRIAQLEKENKTLRNRPRLTREEVKERIAELDQENWSAPEIAKRMTQDGERISPTAVRQQLSRLRRQSK